MRTVRQNASLGNTNVATVRQKCDAQRLGKPHVATVRQKCVAKRIPFSRNSLSVNQKWQPFVRNATEKAYRRAEMGVLPPSELGPWQLVGTSGAIHSSPFRTRYVLHELAEPLLTYHKNNVGKPNGTQRCACNRLSGADTHRRKLLRHCRVLVIVWKRR